MATKEIDPDGIVKRFEKSLKLAMDQGAELAAQESADFAPLGWTGQLKRGIDTLPAKIEGNAVVGFLTASAKSAGGFDYAAMQHNEKLKHAKSQPPLNRGFQDFGQGRTAEKRYQSGYRKRRNKPPRPFKALFLEKGVKKATKDILTLVKLALKKA
jgi:hypothetical protein